MMADGFDTNQRISQGLHILSGALRPYVEGKMQEAHGPRWQQRASFAKGSDLSKPLDMYALLKTMIDNWNDVFRNLLKPDVRNYVSLAFTARNEVAHASGVIAQTDAITYLSAFEKIANAIAAKTALSGLKKLAEDQMKAAAQEHTPPAQAAKTTLGLENEVPDSTYKWRPWRDVAPPHPDVTNARFVEAEFAADLTTVALGNAAETYQDPREFFRVTYMTDGLKAVLRNAIERLSGKGGEPVIGLQTAFGGGKTHTMLALYHLASAKNPETLPGLESIFASAGASTLTLNSKPVVFVGTSVGPHQPMVSEGGRKAHTLWGMLAVKLGGWEAYETIRKSDEERTNPGSIALIEILKQGSPCLILLDEVAAYARNLEGVPFDAYVSFFQSLTEAAKAVPGALVVGSLPESNTEVGDRVRVALTQLEKIFGRVQSAWTPATGIETFEIIRRRLFQELGEDGEKAREQAVKAFASYYKNNADQFPSEVREKSYEEQMRAAYPVHPELFRLLQTDWGSLDKFQRTRGVLKMMAQIVFRLWRDEHNSPVILPGSVPLADDKVRTNALVPLLNGYASVLDKEVAGDLARTAQIEARTPSLGKNRAVTRAATALFMGTAPFGTNNKGMEVARLRLACAIPGDQPSQFSEAIRRLKETSAYLYDEGDRYWFSTQPTLNQVADDRAKGLSDNQIEEEVLNLIRAEEKNKGHGGFHRIHAAPDDPLAIEDAHEVALILLPADATHTARATESSALKLATDIVERRGSGQRLYRNRLAFLAGDEAQLADLRTVVRRKLAWASIVADAEGTLQLTPNQRKDAESKLEEARRASERSFRTTWKHLLLPVASEDTSSAPGKGFTFEASPIANKNADPLPPLVWGKCKQDGLIVDRLGVPILLNDLGKVWRTDQPHVAVKQLRDWFAQFPYLSKLRDPVVLSTAIEEAAGKLGASFGIAHGYDEASQSYRGLTLDKNVQVRAESDMLLVGRDTAEKVLGQSTTTGTVADGTPGKPVSGPGLSGSGAQPSNARPTRFYATIEIDPSRPVPQVSQIAQSILSELGRASGAKVRVKLDIEADAASGFPEDVEAVVKDNAATLKFGTASFEKE